MARPLLKELGNYKFQNIKMKPILKNLSDSIKYFKT